MVGILTRDVMRGLDRVLASGTGARFGGAANLDAFTETRWVTMRAEIAPYPF